MDTESVRNLTCHRSTRSVWDRRGWNGVAIEERLGPWLVSMAGAGLLIAGARRRSLSGVRLMLSGAGLIGCAAAGFCNPRHAGVQWRRLTRPRTEGVVIDLMDSFPASDAPPSSAMAFSAVLLADL